ADAAGVRARAGARGAEVRLPDGEADQVGRGGRLLLVPPGRPGKQRGARPEQVTAGFCLASSLPLILVLAVPVMTLHVGHGKRSTRCCQQDVVSLSRAPGAGRRLPGGRVAGWENGRTRAPFLREEPPPGH